MTAQGCHQVATPQKNLSLRSALAVAVLGTSFFLTVGVNKSRAGVIESATEDISQVGREYAGSKGGSTCNHLQNVTTFMGNTAHPVRGGKYAFQHVVDRCGERSELRGKATAIGKTYWYGWSVFMPSDWKDSDAGHDIITQWHVVGDVNFKKACGAGGPFIARGRDARRGVGGGSVDFFLQHVGDTPAIECNKFHLGKVSEMRGKWVDFVMNMKWTANQDGFLKLWMKIGDGSYTQKIDYKGHTFVNGESRGPFFKMGNYKGDPNWKGPAPRTIYTDEYRLGDANSSFEEVAPGGGK